MKKGLPIGSPFFIFLWSLDFKMMQAKSVDEDGQKSGERSGHSQERCKEWSAKAVKKAGSGGHGQ